MIDYERELNREQYEVVTHGEGPCLVLAGAGTGKTRTIVYRVAYLLEHGVPPDRILLLTFTNKAAHEMMHRLEALLELEPKGLWGGTFHHIAHRMLRMYGEAVGLQKNFAIIDQEDARSLVKECMAEVGIAKDSMFPKPDVFQSLISFAHNSLDTIAEVCADRGMTRRDVVDAFEKVNTLYEQKKRAGGLLDFDDMLGFWKKLVTSENSARDKILNKFDYILVDEYQDTNKLQGAIVEALAGTQRNILVVGDDAQSIYRFRAATVENILHFPKLWPDTKMYRLEENYRSTPDILALANSAIKNNSNQFEKQLRSQTGGLQKPYFVTCSGTGEEARFICKKIVEHARQSKRGINGIAVLFRSSFNVLDVELELQKRGIPYILRGGVRFFEQAHIKDIVSFIRLSHNLRDELAWKRVLAMADGVGAASIDKIIKSIREVPLDQDIYDAVTGSVGGRAKGGTDAMVALVRSIASTGDDVAGALDHALATFYRGYAKVQFENHRDRIEDITALVGFAGKYATREAFLADAVLSEGFKGQGTQDEPDNVLVLSTIHQAKGLEWETVFVVGLRDGQFPHFKSMMNQGEVEEERRLFYVAVTRAEKYLYLTYPMTSYAQGAVTFAKPSQFVRELDEELLEVVDEAGTNGGAGFSPRFKKYSFDDDVTYVDE